MQKLGLRLLKRCNGSLLRFSSSESAVKEVTTTTTTKRKRNEEIETRVPERTHHQEAELAYKSLQNITMNPISILNHAKNENENDYAFNHVHKRLEEKFSDLGEKITSLSVKLDLAKLDRLLKIGISNETDEIVKGTCDKITQKIRNLDHFQLAILLSVIRKREEYEYKQIIRFIDVRLKWLLKKNNGSHLADLDLWLYLADVLYESKIKSTLIMELTGYLADGRQKSAMSNKQVLHLLFLLIINRTSNTLLAKYEERIFDLLDEASIKDLAIISLAYFKTKTIIQNQKLLNGIVDRTTKNLASIDPKEPGYCSIVKSIRYSRTQACRDNVLQMISSLTDDPEHRVVFGSPYNAVHSVKLMEAYRIYEPRMLHMLRQVLFRDLDEFRIKDIQYALTSLSNFAYMDLEYDKDLWRDFDKLAENILTESRLDRPHQDYHLIPILRAFSVFGYYNDKLVSYAKRRMSDEGAIRHMKGVLEFEKSALIVHAAYHVEAGNASLIDLLPLLKQCSATIDRGSNYGSVKRDNSLNHLGFILAGNSRLPNASMYRSIAQSLADSRELSDQQFRCNFQHTFPHQNYVDLVITRDEPEPGSFDPETLLPKPVLEGRKACVIYAVQKTDFVDGKARLCGYKRLMMRLFEKLGYAVLPVDLHNPDTANLARRAESILTNNC